jgi:uncharacterized membrane protein SirB2
MLPLKALHISCVIISYSLFFLRGLYLLGNSSRREQRWIKVAPHLIDSVLLISAISLAWQLGYSPMNSSWLATKIIALILYIGLGFIAFRFATSYKMRLAAWLSAQVCFSYIAAVAITHDPFFTLSPY